MDLRIWFAHVGRLGKKYEGKKHAKAVLYGYSRAFNKKSVQNWGSRANPGPTLGLEVGEGVKCVGSAFEFPDEKEKEVLTYLRGREGDSFTLERLSIELPNGRRAEAYTPVNDTSRNTYIESNDVQMIARMVKLAKGTSGKCSDYVANIRGKLRELGIEDEAIEELWKSISAEEPA